MRTCFLLREAALAGRPFLVDTFLVVVLVFLLMFLVLVAAGTFGQMLMMIVFLLSVKRISLGRMIILLILFRCGYSTVGMRGIRMVILR